MKEIQNKYEVEQECREIIRNIFGGYEPFTALQYEIEEMRQRKEFLEKKLEATENTNDIETIESNIETIENDIEELKENFNIYETDIQDYIHEQVDGHQWVIYTFYHSQLYSLFRCDENVVAEYEEFSYGDKVNDLDDLLALFAYCVLDTLCNSFLDEEFESWKGGL